jgi:hypothetical protein
MFMIESAGILGMSPVDLMKDKEVIHVRDGEVFLEILPFRNLYPGNQGRS